MKIFQILFFLSLTLSLSAQIAKPAKAVELTIFPEKKINVKISPFLFGVNMFMYSANNGNEHMERRLKEANVLLLETPGGNPRGRTWWHNNTLGSSPLPQGGSVVELVQLARRIGAEPMIGINDRYGIVGEQHPDYKNGPDFYR